MEEYLNRLREYLARAVEWIREASGDAFERVRDWWRRRRLSRAERAREDHEAAITSRRALADDAAVITATAEDDVASVVGRIDTADTLEVVLVVRRDARALRRPTAWPHIAAHVRRHGIVLGVVSSRGDVRSYARENGLRAARTPGGLRPDDYYLRVGDRDFAVPPVPWGRIVRGAMIIAFLGAAFVVGCYQVPSAEIRLVPASEEFTASGEARANAIIEVSDVETETITANTVRRQIVTAVTTTTTGEVEVGDLAATLQVRFTNNGGEPVDIPGGTRVATEEGVTFLTDEPIQVPADDVADIGATAEFPGVGGNVAVGTIVSGEELPEGVTVTNITPGSGGTNRLAQGVIQEDVDRVREIADQVLQRVAASALELAAEEEELGTLLPATVTASVFSERPMQQLEEASDILVVEYTVIAAGLVVTPGQAADYGEQLILQSLPEGQALLPGSVTAEITPPAERDGRLVVNARGRVATLQEIAQIADQLVGMRPGDARALLQDELRLDAPPEIEVSPNFIPWVWLPRRADHIEIVIVGPDVEEPADEGDEDPEGEAGGDGDGDALPSITPEGDSAATSGGTAG